MNPVMSVYIEDFLVVPDEVIDGLPDFIAF